MGIFSKWCIPGWTPPKPVDLDALDAENDARDALTERFDLSWRDRD